jgi:adenine-specific DNA-methyltransferase
MARAKKVLEKGIETYTHKDKERMNNPQAGLVTSETDPDRREKKVYEYDPHLDPQLQWAGKAEHTQFEIPTVSLHVHERIDSKTIIDAAKNDKQAQPSLFADFKPLREAIEFYKHKENWSNRLIAGDSLLVMNSLLEKEGYAGKVQMVYFDPPYGIKYGSNFQPFVNKRDVKDGKDEDLSSEPEMIKAFRDTWELGIHSYLTYLRDRLLLARELLSESGSVFVQISDENVHHVREIMDEVFGKENFVSLITVTKTSGMGTKLLPRQSDYLVWYAKDKEIIKYRQLFKNKSLENEGAGSYDHVELEDGGFRRLSREEREDSSLIPLNSQVFRFGDLTKPGPGRKYEVEWNGKKFNSGARWWGFPEESMYRLLKLGRVAIQGNTLAYKRYLNDFSAFPITNNWIDTGTGGTGKIYVVQTNEKMIERCMLMTTDPSDLVLDITCGSGTTAYVAEQWGRRWITCDTSRVALTLAKQRLMTAVFDYYQLKYPSEGVSSGFNYKTVPHITLKSIANNEPPAVETLYDQPIKETNKVRVTGPFTVEAVPAPNVKSLDDIETEQSTDELIGSIARSGETLRHHEWRDELLKTGIRAKDGQKITFSRVETSQTTQYIQAVAETKENDPKKVFIIFGSEFAPLDSRTVENAWQESRFFKPHILLFCAFQFDDEAAKNIDELKPEIAGMQLLKVQMNADLLTDDLRKNRSSNESFWLIGQPDVKIHSLENNQLQVEVLGFDYYNPKTGDIESGNKNNIAMWLLDTDYNGRSLFPKQVFFPMAGNGDGWEKLAKNLKADIDEDKIEMFKGTISLPFEKSKKIAVKIIDDRGIESLRVIQF